MNIHVTGVIVKWHTNYTQIKFPRYFREIVIFSNFYEVHDEKCSFLSFSTTRVKRSIWNQYIFYQSSCCINIDKNSYPEETELGINHSLTLAQTLTPSTGQRSFGHFTSSLC